MSPDDPAYQAVRGAPGADRTAVSWACKALLSNRATGVGYVRQYTEAMVGSGGWIMRRALVSGVVIWTLALMTVFAQQPSPGLVTLFDGSHLNNFNKVGNANWKLADGTVEATSGSGFLVSKENYGDFEIRVEFWVDEGANSGVYLRCQDANTITDTTCYEANIFDKRPDQSGRTGHRSRGEAARDRRRRRQVEYLRNHREGSPVDSEA
jgi:hypothetical protein